MQFRNRGVFDGFSPIQASSGTVSIITLDGVQHRVHTFTTLGQSTFTIVSPGSSPEISCLIVGGGGGGGSANANTPGGGGYPGTVTEFTLNAVAGAVNVFVGASGVGGTAGQESYIGPEGSKLASAPGGAAGPNTGNNPGNSGTISSINGVNVTYAISGENGQNNRFGFTPAQFGSGGGGGHARPSGAEVGLPGRNGVVIFIYPIDPAPKDREITVPPKMLAPIPAASKSFDIITWQAPSTDNNDKITRYYWESNDGKSGNTTSLGATVDQEDNTSQSYRVRAENSAGLGPWSDYGSSVTTQAPFFPFFPFFPHFPPYFPPHFPPFFPHFPPFFPHFPPFFPHFPPFFPHFPPFFPFFPRFRGYGGYKHKLEDYPDPDAKKNEDDSSEE